MEHLGYAVLPVPISGSARFLALRAMWGIATIFISIESCQQRCLNRWSVEPHGNHWNMSFFLIESLIDDIDADWYSLVRESVISFSTFFSFWSCIFPSECWPWDPNKHEAHAQELSAILLYTICAPCSVKGDSRGLGMAPQMGWYL